MSPQGRGAGAPIWTIARSGRRRAGRGAPERRAAGAAHERRRRRRAERRGVQAGLAALRQRAAGRPGVAERRAVILVTFLLVVYGLVMAYSASSAEAYFQYDSSFYFRASGKPCAR